MKTKRTWTTRTMLAVFATALTAVGCNADQGSTGTEKTAEVKDSIVKIGEFQEGCAIRTVYDLRSAKAIEVVAIDAGEWTGEDLTLNLYEVNEEGEETRIDTRAVSMKHLLKQQSAAARRAEAQSNASETSDYTASSRSGRSSTATESSNSSSQSSNTSDETIMELVENEANLYHLVDNAMTHSRSVVTDADADEAARLDAAEESVQVSSDRDVSISESDDLLDGDWKDIGSDRDVDIDESESVDASSSSVSVDQQASASESSLDQLDEDAADRQEEILQSSDRSLVNSSRSSSDSSAVSTSSDSLVAMEESEFSEVSESSATSSDMYSLEDSAESDESMVEETLEEMSEEFQSFASRALVFSNLQDLKTNHLRLEVVFEGSIDATNLDLFMGSKESEITQLDSLFSESFNESFNSCELDTTGSVDVGTIGDDSVEDSLDDLGDLARDEDLGI